MSIVKITDSIIWFSYLALAIITPLLFTTQNTELFEVPKMIFVYFMAVIIFFATLIKFVLNGKIIIPKTPIFIALTIFLTIQIASTLFSIDKFTSVFGYPSRLNGGLISQFAYLIIFTGILINLMFDQIKKLLLAIVLSAFVVSLWGIPSHFAFDPTCYILTEKLSSNCWQDEFNPTLRIFSTLGQPNWLASYLILILPIALALTLIEKKLQSKIFFLIVTLTIFIAFIFTNSRAGAIGLISALLIFIAALGLKIIKNNLKIILPTIIAFLIIPFFFGLKLILRVDDTIQIRQIVWQGAIEVFKKNPLLGTGPETFAYSYYQNRPLAHNNTAEWNFFYNKAHNEFLNNLANIGILGTFAYVTFLILSISLLLKKIKTSSMDALIPKAIASSIIGYQISIFFGFSIVVSQLVMFTLIACAIKYTLVQINSINIKIKENFKFPISIAIIILGAITLSIPLRLYFADLILNRAKNYESENPAKALLAYQSAIDIFPTANPFYLSDYSYFQTVYQTSYETDSTNKLITAAANNAHEAQKLSPNNLIVLRRVANTYLLISGTDASYETKAFEIGQRLIELAPTDPQSYFSLAKIQAGIGKEDEAKKTLKKTLELKPDYQEAAELLEQLTITN